MLKFNKFRLLHCILIILVTILLNFGAARDKEKDIKKEQVPEAVLQAFNQAYPGASVKAYSEEKEDGQTFYEVSCIYDGSKIDAIYRPDGSVAAVEEVIPESELPDAVKEGFAAEIKNGAINAAEKIDKDGKRLYELKAINNKSEKQYELIFSADGKMINKEMKKTEEREDEETEGIHKEGSADVTIPDAVKAAFKAKFPGAAEMEWGMESDSEYEAEFELNEAEMSANFDPHGKWLETETTLSAKKLPAQVAAAMKKDFGDYNINKIEKLEKAEKPVMYEIILTKGGKEIEVILDETGRIHKKR